MSERTIALPVRATMRRQADGRFKMTDVEWVQADASVVAALIAERFGLLNKDENERRNVRQAVKV